MKNRKGFTMIELLATVTILGILMTITIGYAMRLINKSKNDSMEQQAKLVTTAAESYFQAHREQLPRLVGQTTKIPISTLLETNYLKKEIKNAKGESCMEKSFITAYKDSRTKYTYKAYLYCGNDTVPSTTSPLGPNITIDFCREETGTCLYKDGDQQVKNSVADAIISIEISGNKIGGEEINLEGYTWSILAKYDGEEELKEVYNSGELSAKGHYSIKIPKETSKQKYILKNYLDLTNTTDITVKVIATNEKGGITEKQKSILYQDTIPPICGTVEGESTTWINKNTPLTDAIRIISVECKDGNGSGCVRNKFTQIWPTSTEEFVEYGNIKIEDNIGLSTECPVAVNIDREAPVIKLEKATTNGNTNILYLNGTSNTTAGTRNDSVTLSEDKYKNLNNNWMNKANYQNGVTYTFTISDNYQLASWKFETNSANINMPSNGNPGSASNYNNLNTNNADGSLAQITGKNKTIQVSFTSDGIRQGKLTVTDKAGNTATFTVKANLDRTNPDAPNVYMGKWNDNMTALSEYQGNWVNKNIHTEATAPTTDQVSGISHVELITETNRSLKANVWDIETEGESTVKYRTCDKAGNCSGYISKTAYIDKTAPVIKLNKAVKRGTATNILKSTAVVTTAGKTNNSATLNYNQYSDLTNNWMNKEKYPNGVEYDFNLTDNSQLASWKFEVNRANVGYNIFSTDSSSSFVLPTKNINIQPLYFMVDGIRQGKLTVKDKAGNTAVFTVKANLDREVPPAPNVYLRKWKNNNGSAPTSRNGLEEYIEGTWSNKNIYTEAEKRVETVTSASHLELATSGLATNISEDNPLKNIMTWNVKAEGTSTVRYRTCDEAGNCSEYNSKTIKLDKTAPELFVNMRTWKDNEPTSISNNDQNKYYGEDTNQNVYIKPSATDNLSGINIESYKISNSSANNSKEKHCKYTWSVAENTKFYTNCPPSPPSERQYEETGYREFRAGDKYNVTQEGRTKVSFQVSDNAGNTKTVTKYVSIDRTKPYAIFTCFQLIPDIIPLFDKVNEVGKNQDFQIIAASQDFWYGEIKKHSTEEKYYGILIEYYDNFSGNYLSREIINGDTTRCPDKGNGDHHKADGRGKFNGDKGYYEGYYSLRDGPASTSPMKSLIKNVCDRAGNCAYTNGRRLDCADPNMIRKENPIIDKADNYLSWNSDCTQ